ncbi:DUF7521 family protein [Candidatus Nitrosotalea okcheonensis]|uniref:Uncharacterized protein n=1 Tax=Candidatus Nitrosotalea okcheonensis TaxID=1903276 RepID=A0A2H1FCT0_9ARCH|nr:hypothetical protein [Candidatus Nitrosotalea okcheonensis]MDE1832479.1 hypothetical protein [Nitrososphaerota archaeon]MDE1841193.1 hypothetical protein [Nitrososphaerota archaeon]MDE1877117.1 hypothetical protein [Nitrososphaerota archaeon]SMH70570.1 conserved membrane protein of unknown function [Candidatus Nitrosotalea okcheonensis]
MVDLSITHYVLLVAHLIVGFILVLFAAKAFKKTKYLPMLLLVIGFTLLVVGETVIEEAFSFLNDENLQKIIEESFEIAGFITLIWAVKKS